jgi:iduronate 2-sulfatase
LSIYVNPVCQTPNLDRLAASGMVFERAYCQGVSCVPSRPSMLRSVYPIPPKKRGDKSGGPSTWMSVTTIGEHLQEHGFHTARVGKVFHMPVPNAQLEGSDGSDVAECWSERHNTKTAETYSPGLYRQLNVGIATREIEGRLVAGTSGGFYTAV